MLIIKGSCRRIVTDAMFELIRCILGIVPLEPTALHGGQYIMNKCTYNNKIGDIDGTARRSGTASG